MFYSTELLALKSSHGGLGLVWLAATVDSNKESVISRRISRRECASIDVPATCSFIINPPQPLSLRLSANLMIGLVRIYDRQCSIYYREAQDLYMTLLAAAQKAQRLKRNDASIKSRNDQHLTKTTASKEAITISVDSNRTMDTGPTSISAAWPDVDQMLDDLMMIPGNSRSSMSARLSGSHLMLTPEQARIASRSSLSNFSISGRSDSISVGHEDWQDQSNAAAAILGSSIPFQSLRSAMDGSGGGTEPVMGLKLLMGEEFDVPLNDVNEDDGSLIFGRSLTAQPPSMDAAMHLSCSDPSMEATNVRTSRQHRFKRHGRKLVFDSETILEREELLLDEGEALVPPMSTEYDYTDELLGIDLLMVNRPVKRSSPRKRSISSAVADQCEYEESFVDDGAEDGTFERISSSIGPAQSLSRLAHNVDEEASLQILGQLPTSFDQLVVNANRSRVCQVFYQVLVMCDQSMIKARQDTCWSSIQLYVALQ